MYGLAKVANENKETSLSGNLAVGGLAGAAAGAGAGAMVAEYGKNDVKEIAREKAKDHTTKHLQRSMNFERSIVEDPDYKADRERRIMRGERQLEKSRDLFERMKKSNWPEKSLENEAKRLAEYEKSHLDYVNFFTDREQMFRDRMMQFEKEPVFQKKVDELTPLLRKQNMIQKGLVGAGVGAGLGLAGGGIAYLANRKGDE